MLLYNLNNWQLFTIAFGLMLFVSFIMMMQSRNFYTFHLTKRRFSIMELETPATYAELVKVIKGLYALPANDSKKSIGALRRQLWVDFLFMPLAYGSVFLICLQVSIKFEPGFWHCIFLILAVIQLIPWICDIIENIYLLKKIKQGPNINDSKEALAAKRKSHKAYLIMEGFKWGIALGATVSAISAVCYFWLTGNYTASSLKYLLIALAEIIIFLILAGIFNKKKAVVR